MQPAPASSRWLGLACLCSDAWSREAAWTAIMRSARRPADRDVRGAPAREPDLRADPRGHHAAHALWHCRVCAPPAALQRPMTRPTWTVDHARSLVGTKDTGVETIDMGSRRAGRHAPTHIQKIVRHRESVGPRTCVRKQHVSRPHSRETLRQQ
eukprot:3153820-Rhodomonas_salina.1